jgi:HEAT repeat protein
MLKKPIRFVLVLLIGTVLAVAQETHAPAGQAPESHVSQPEAPPPPRAPDTRGSTSARTALTEKVKQLSSTDPAKIAAAAYWLGEQGTAASGAVPHLAAVLGDNRQVNPAHYRKNIAGRASSTPGEEAAAALVKIGDPAVDALIRVLKTSPSAVARQNAAWALGIIQDRHPSDN